MNGRTLLRMHAGLRITAYTCIVSAVDARTYQWLGPRAHYKRVASSSMLRHHLAPKQGQRH